VLESEASKQPFPFGHLLTAIGRLGAEAQAPFPGFAAMAARLGEVGEALNDQEYPRAGEILEAMDAVFPDCPYVIFHKGFVLRQDGREEEAFAQYQRAAQLAPRIPMVWNALGTMLAQNGQSREAIQAFLNTVRIHPEDIQALDALVKLRAAVRLVRDPNKRESVVYMPVEQFRELLAPQVEAMHEPDQLLQFGEAQLREGYAPDVALKALEKADKIRPGHARTLAMLVQAALTVQQVETAVRYARLYTERYPNEAQAWLLLAQALGGAGDSAAETAALDKALALDPNSQTALVVRFRVNPAEATEEKEQEVARFGDSARSWMAYLVASSLARDQKATERSVAWAERAFAIAPEVEEVLLHLCAVLGDAKDVSKLETLIQPAWESGLFSRRLDWNYAQALYQAEQDDEAVSILKRALDSNVPDDFRTVAAAAVDSWTGYMVDGGIAAEVHRVGTLRRPILLTLADGDGGILLTAGSPMPGEARFQWRTFDDETAITIQQGQTGGSSPVRSLGKFTIREAVVTDPEAGARLECHLVIQQDGTPFFTVMQDQRKLRVDWDPA
jgi:predicted Zn-dependent protease